MIRKRAFDIVVFSNVQYAQNEWDKALVNNITQVYTPQEIICINGGERRYDKQKLKYYSNYCKYHFSKEGFDL